MCLSGRQAGRQVWSVSLGYGARGCLAVLRASSAFIVVGERWLAFEGERREVCVCLACASGRALSRFLSRLEFIS